MLLSVHIPKTGGVTFRNMLKESFGPGFVLNYWEITDAWGRVLPEVPSTATCVHGHYVPDGLSDRFPAAKLVTWVRNPVERVASSYYHRLRDPDWRNSVSRKVHEEKLSLLEFAELPETRNEMAHFMGRRRPAEYDFIGVLECFDEALTQFCRQFGMPLPTARRDNRNPARNSAFYPLNQHACARIQSLNELDLEIYSESLDLFWARRRDSLLARVG